MKRFCLVVVFALVGCGASAPDPEDALAEIETMYAEYKADFPDVKDIGAEALAARLDDGDVVLVDVREPEEQAVSMIRGAVTKEIFEQNKERHRDTTVVTHCTIGYRSGVYAATLQKEGFDVRNFKGSVLAWAHHGGDFVNQEGEPTKRVHVYGPKWNLLPPEYEAVW